MQIQTRRADKTVIVDVEGELDIATVEEFQNSVNQEISAGGNLLVLNFRKVQFVDSTGVGTLLHVYRALTGQGVKVRICEINESVREIFDLLGLPVILGEDALAISEADALKGS